MCCCCPTVISAIFCLWVQSGFSKGTVAGALLLFFPPDPPLYKFERFDKDGNILPPLNDDDDEDDDDDDDENDENDENENKKKKGSGTANAVTGGEVIDRGDGNNGNGTDASTTGVEVVTDGTYQAREGQSKEKVRSPAQQFTDQARALRIRGKKRNVRDTKDAANGISYKLVLDPRLQPPRFHNGGTVEAVKIPTGKTKKSKNSTTTTSSPKSEAELESELESAAAPKTKSFRAKAKDKKLAQSTSHCAAIVYKVPPTNLETTSQGKKNHDHYL